MKNTWRLVGVSCIVRVDRRGRLLGVEGNRGRRGCAWLLLGGGGRRWREEGMKGEGSKRDGRG